MRKLYHTEEERAEYIRKQELKHKVDKPPFLCLVCNKVKRATELYPKSRFIKSPVKPSHSCVGSRHNPFSCASHR